MGEKKKVIYFGRGKKKLSFQELKSLIPIPQGKNSHVEGYKVTHEAAGSVVFPIPFAGVNTFCKAQSTFKAQDKILTVPLISTNSGSFCDGYEGLSEGP